MLNFSRLQRLSLCCATTLLLLTSTATAGSLGSSSTLDLLSVPGNFLTNSDGYSVEFDLASIVGNVPLELDEVTATFSNHNDGRVFLEFQIASFYAGLEVPGDVWDLAIGFSVSAPNGVNFVGAGLSSASMSASGKAKVKISEGIIDGLGILGDLAELSIFDTETTLRKKDTASFSPTQVIYVEKDILNAIAADAPTGSDFPDTHLTYFKQTYFTAEVPEPTTLLMCLFAGVGVAAVRSRR